MKFPEEWHQQLNQQALNPCGVLKSAEPVAPKAEASAPKVEVEAKLNETLPQSRISVDLVNATYKKVFSRCEEFQHGNDRFVILFDRSVHQSTRVVDKVRHGNGSVYLHDIFNFHFFRFWLNLATAIMTAHVTNCLLHLPLFEPEFPNKWEREKMLSFYLLLCSALNTQRG